MGRMARLGLEAVEGQACWWKHEKDNGGVALGNKNKRVCFVFRSTFRNFGYAELTLHSAKQNEKLVFFFCIALVFS